jgi:diaminopimelate epimerase
MHVTNADGSHAEMCGNGLRCVALHVARTAPEEVTSLVIETDAGLRDCAVTRTGPDKAEVSVDMGVVMVGPAPGVPGSVKLEVEGMPVRATAANVGNPHMVMDLPPNQQQARRVGESLTRTPVFPAGVNVEWMSLDANGGLIVLVYERGAGLTLACGTGAVAAAFVAAKWGWVDLVGPRGVSVRLPGGTLWVKQDAGGRARLTGPAQHVFSAQVDLASLGIRP